VNYDTALTPQKQFTQVHLNFWFALPYRLQQRHCRDLMSWLHTICFVNCKDSYLFLTIICNLKCIWTVHFWTLCRRRDRDKDRGRQGKRTRAEPRCCRFGEHLDDCVVSLC